ncbi:Flp family type IVb pilin [Sphingobium sp. EM0848]|uniref:Flp family type IVb pilin n=1 Tax=Sphingobium sp. EM0848 TaxID=2743473 RepID=UPI00159CA10A|nr:Flp family type IVb pilin [Sphingobium sp. EM0848]
MRALIKSFRLRGLAACQRGATAVEYGLILALICLAIIGAMSSVANKTIGMWNNVATEVLAH